MMRMLSFTDWIPGARAAFSDPRLSPEAVLGPERAEKWLERAKYRWRMQTSAREREQFLLALHAHPAWNEMFGREPGLHYVPLRAFLDKSFSSTERYEACASDLTMAWCLWGAVLSARLAHGQSVVLFSHAGFEVALMRNRVSPHEGLWALQLTTPGGDALFNLSFGFPAEGQCLVGSVQGLRCASEDNLATIRSFTKAAHGLRPHGFLLACLQAACRAWGLPALWGIDTAQQVKRRRNADKQGFRFDYRAFWESQGGRPDEASGRWHLPATPPRKAEADIPSHKRSEYRRRFGLLDQLGEQVAQRLQAASLPTPAATV